MSATACYRHPTRLAVEHCEACQRPVCGSCLWYAESGERLCPDHAADALKQGQTVVPPERYAEGIPHAEVSAARPSAADIPYQGNSTDVAGLLAALSGVVALLTCAGLTWAVPLLGFSLGLVAWLHARDAINPTRTRWLAGLGLAGSSVFVLIILGFFLLIMLCWLGVAAATFSGPRPFPTPIPFSTLTPTP